MKDRRRLKREHIMFYSRVFDRETGALLGYLGDLTPIGCMVIGEKSLAPDTDYMLRIDLPEDMYPKPVLNVSAQSVYCRPDVDPRFYTIGFSFQDLRPEDVAIVEQIVADFRLQDR